MEVESSSSLSQDSLCSLTAEGVLVHSTGVHREKPIDAEAGAGDRMRKATIAVKNLCEAAFPCQGAGAVLAGGGTRCVPSAFTANEAPEEGATTGTPGSAAPGVLSTKGHPECLLSVRKSAEPVFLSQMDYPREATVQDASLLLEGNRRLKDDVFISQYATSQKEALKAVLKQKAQNAPILKEVKVQLLGNTSTEKKESFGHETRSAYREVDSAATITAATAAAIATTAPLLKVQNELEAKVNSVAKLLHKLQETDRPLQCVAEQQTNTKTGYEKPHCHEGVSELAKQINVFMVQRIQHLEKLQEQQMNIQSHLISSAVNMGGLQQIHLPSSSLMAKQSEKPEQQFLTSGMSSCQGSLFPTSGSPAQGEGRFLEHILNSQEMPLRQTEFSERATLNSNKMSWHSERDRYTALRTDSFPTFESSFQKCNSVEKMVKKADDLLQDLGQLRRDMHDVLQEANSWKSDMNDLIKSKKPTVASNLPEHHQLNKPLILQNVKTPKSILKDAERILRGVQNSKKFLEENLEAVIHAKDGDAMYTFINVLTANRDVLEEIRIRKTVDEWIKAISIEIQAEMTRNDLKQRKYDQKVPWINKAQNVQAMKTNKEIKAKTQKIQGCLTKNPLSAAKPLQRQGEDNMSKQGFRTYFSSESLQRKEERAAGPVSGSAMVQNEDYLYQVYGKPIYQGHRSTLKKAPYLRFNSPSSKSKLQRPRVIECVRGTKVKSARTQTCSHTQKIVTSPRKQHPLYALAQESQYLFSPSKDVPAVCGPLEGHLIPMAIPLGQTQISDISLQAAGVVIGKPDPVTVTTSLPQVPPKLPVEIKKKTIAVIEMRSEKKNPPQQSLQVLPNVDTDSISSDSMSVTHVLPGSEPVLPPVNAVIQTPGDVHCEEEGRNFPGTNFIDATDVRQDQEEEGDEILEFFEPLLDLNGQFKVALPKYNGPLFPPVASAPQQSSDVLDELIQRRETIENGLINWVEQEIMSKIISGMYTVQKETVPNVSTSESEDSETATSNVVEVAGGGGFQLFINAGVPVDSEMISHFVNEVLSETIATMLGNRQSQKAVPATNVLPSATVTMESLVPTPLPTPQATPPQTPPSEFPPVKTPESSLSLTEISVDVHGQEKIKETGVEIPAVTSRVVTPVVTPVSTPPRTTTPSPPASEWISKAAKGESTNPWDDAELPLEEEKPSTLTEEPFCPKAVEMSVAQYEEPEGLIFPSHQFSVRPFESLPYNPQVPPPVPTVSSGQSTQESSLILTETETADRPLSEGEVLFNCGQILAAREGGLSLPNLAESLKSTLQDANEMDYDPPSEGQVVRRLGKGYHRDPVLTLLAKLNQAPVAAKGGMYHLEDSDDSVGELSEGQRPRLTRAAERILTRQSVYMDHPNARTPENRRHQGFHSPLPGQLAQIGEILGDADTNCSPMLMAELELQRVSYPVLQTELSCRVTYLSEDLSQDENRGAVEVETVRPRVIHVRKKSEEMQQEGEDAAPHINSHVSAAKVSLKLPSMDIDNETQSMSSIHGNSDSVGTDTF
ncbi:TALD3 protein, partial [Rhinoptilus africanus]|nr:TALD3 protein [Rhinoptilus africanus]